MPMKPEEAEWWARTRAKGRARFIWVDGVLQWGLLIGVLLLAVSSLIYGWDNLALRVLAALLVCPIGGYRWGVRVWQLNERRYAETVGKDAGS